MADPYSIGRPTDAVVAAGADGTVIALLKRLTTQMAAGGVGTQVEGQIANGVAPTGENPLLLAGWDATLKRTLLTDTSGRPAIVGGVASGVASAGVNPVLLAIETGAAQVRAAFGDLATADAVSGSAYMMRVQALGYDYNGATFDRRRGNLEGVAFASAARTAAPATFHTTNYNARGVLVQLVVTAASGTGGLTLRIRGGISTTDSAYLNASPTAVIATGYTTYMLYPGIGTAAGSVVQNTSQILPRHWGVDVTVGDASSYTYQVVYCLIL